MKYLLLLPLLIACQGKSGGSSDVTIEKFEVSQDVQMSAHISSDEIVLSNLLPAGSIGSDCGPSPESGKKYTYELVNDTLVLDDSRVQVTYERITDEGGILSGKWKLLSSSDRNMQTGTLEFKDNSVHFISYCSQ
ncbi:MAG: hypothetical protein V4598_08870 [Bdellovibrionota bacterium]